MKRSNLRLIAILLLGSALARTPALADDELKLGADKNSVTLSGVSSGAAMALQYAIANSATVMGVAAIAGAGWGCAEGKFSKAADACMCGRQPVSSQISEAIRLTQGPAKLFDPLDPKTGKPLALRKAFVFHSPADQTVVAASGLASVAFLQQFIGSDPKTDWGKPGDGSNHAGHGILSPQGDDACAFNGKEKTYVRKCKKHDNAGDLFHAFYGDPAPGKAAPAQPDMAARLKKFKQTPFIEAVRNDWPKPIVATDLPVGHSDERLNFDLAEYGYVYVPGNCGPGKPQCRVHIALHGCKQNAETFAKEAGYNDWAEKYDVIVIYPAIKPFRPAGLPESQFCPSTKQLTPAQWQLLDASPIEVNYNGCWDWWGYLDSGNEALEETKTRYLTKEGPQMKFLHKVIEAVTADIK